ncbi:MAG: hypothetical protein ACI8QZ_004210, partial [Chlamydiales bacterium]
MDREPTASPHDDKTRSSESGGSSLDARDEAMWAVLVGATDPRALLGFLDDGDPLGLLGRTVARLRYQAMLLELDHVHARVVARVAFECVMLKKRPAPRHVGAWIDERIDRSMEELDREDREALRQGLLAYEQWDARYLFLHQGLGVPAKSTRGCCLVFNGLARDVRRAFFAVSIEGLSLDKAARA